MASPTSPPRRTRGTVAATLLVLAGTLAALALAGWRPAALVAPWSDLQAYFLPKYAYAAAELARGRLPLWNPHEFCGIPFLATLQPAVFHPPTRLAFALASGEAAWCALFFLHLAVGALGALALARAFGCGPSAALLAAGWVVQPSWLGRMYDHPVYLMSATVVPWIVLLVRRAVHAPGARAAALLGLAAALQALVGYPPYVLATTYLAAVALAASLVDVPASSRPRAARVVATLAGALVVAGLVAAAQVLPAVELVTQSRRGVEAAEFRRSFLELGAQSPALLDLLSMPPLSLAGTGRALWREIGPIVLGLGLMGWRLGWRSGGMWWATVALGLCAIPWSVREHLPLQYLVRFGTEWYLLLPLVAFIAAALGLEVTGRRVGRLRAPCALAALWLTTAWNWSGVPRHWYGIHLPSDEPPRAAIEHYCEEGGRFRIFRPGLYGAAGAVSARLRSISGYEQSLLPERAAMLADELGVGNGALGPAWAEHLAGAVELASRAGLRCVVVDQGPVLRGAGFEPRALPGTNAHAYVNPRALPRARMAYVVLPARTPEEALQRVRDGAGEAVVLEGGGAQESACDGPDRMAEIVHDAPEEVAVEVATSCPGWFVLADTFAPGWTAAVDGRPQPIVPADAIFRAVAVPAGRHTVVFRYAPWTVRVGLALSALGLVVALGLLGARTHHPPAP
jgi:hypothetical protein